MSQRLLHLAAPWAALLPPLLALALGAEILQTPDGLAYLADLRDGADLIHPHHVLYGPLVLLTARLLAPWGGDLLAAAQGLGAVACALILTATWRLARLRLDRRDAWLAVALLAALRGLPLYTVRAEVYLPLIAAQAWLLALVVEAAALPRRTASRRLGLGLLLGLGALLHQLGALVAAPLLLTAWAPLRERLQVVAVGGALALAVSAAGHLSPWAAYRGPGLLDWLLTYARADVPEWGAAAHFSPAGVRDLLAGIAAMAAPLPRALVWPAGLLTAAVLTALALGARRAAPVARLVALWLILQLLFVLWWLPTDTDFAVLGLWPLWALGVLTCPSPPARGLRPALAALAVLLLVVNYGVSLPRLERLGRSERTRLRALAPLVTAADYAELDFPTRMGLRWYGGVDPRWDDPALSGTGP